VGSGDDAVTDLLRDLAARHALWNADGLALCFLIPVLVVSAAAALFAPGYLRQPRYAAERPARFWVLYVLFVGGMAVAVLAADLVLFLVGWEVMTLASYALVAYETRDPHALRAAFKYMVMTHAGAACLLLGAVLLRAAGGSFAFADLPATFASAAASRPGLLHAALALMFVGFATKAGLWPFGDWLPDAHPAAPAPVSAALSGVMVKLGLYGLLRVFADLLGPAAPGVAAAWGGAMVAFGAVSAVVGGLAACAASDIKVLLAHSTVAQSGLIALGIGGALALGAEHPALAALAMTGALFHAVTDAAVKALLFLAAGAVQWRTGSRRLEELGGLFQGMPVTGWAALLGAFAIAGFPPLTAFVGKWLMLQATVLSRSPLITAAGFALLAGSVLSALYAVRFFAGTFATRVMREDVLDPPPAMSAAQIGLAAGVVAMSLAPGVVLAAIARAIDPLLPAAARGGAAWRGFALEPPGGSYAPLALLGVGLVAALVARVAIGGGRATRRAPWTGGVPAADGGPAVAAHGLYAPWRDALGRAAPALRLRAPARPGWVPAAADLDRWVYGPAAGLARRMGEAMRRVHTGVPHVYLLWQLAGALAVALLALALVRR
jgi:hydrogenase-4 component B